MTLSDCSNLTIEQTLKAQWGDQLCTNVPMAPYTSIKVGGPARFLLEVTTSQELIEAYRNALQLNLPFYLLAGCSNVFVDDTGLNGLVIINKSNWIEWNDDFTVSVAGGYNLDHFIKDLSKKGWGDLTFAAGIPGSLGGALVGGAGAFGHLVCEFLIEASVLHRDGSVDLCTVEDLGIEYRNSAAKRRKDIILDVKMGPFQSYPVDSLMENIERIKSEREVKHPGIDLPSAGSFFKNLPPEEPGGRRRAAGIYLDKAGVKGLRIGDAGVFEKHANIIVNHGHATAEQVDELAELMAQRVKEQFGIDLEREVQYLR